MNTLFPIDAVYPGGFTYEPGFISDEEELRLLNEIKQVELHQFNFKGFVANRKVASFGYDYSFEKGTLTEGAAIPQAFNFLIEKVATRLSLAASDFAELLIIEYPVGAVMNWHRDAFPFDLIAGISLSSDCTFRLRPHDAAKQSRAAILSFPVRRRSLYVMQGEARTEWQHSVTAAKQPRYSITLRTLKASDNG